MFINLFGFLILRKSLFYSSKRRLCFETPQILICLWQYHLFECLLILLHNYFLKINRVITTLQISIHSRICHYLCNNVCILIIWIIYPKLALFNNLIIKLKANDLKSHKKLEDIISTTILSWLNHTILAVDVSLTTSLYGI